ncbi:MAG TPA: DHHA1 domain-containing protein, partial [Baekduia sp.]|nr:DHHA1 domain-containing protein [Baekduia sp.]
AEVTATVDRSARVATQANHTATHLLHAALRERLGTHVRQAGSYVGPDKLRFDFTHGQRLTPEELKDVEDRVNGWILQADPVRPITTTLDEAKALGAMALFGEKYGDVVRMVQIGDGDYSRELCGGTHVRSTAEIGVFRITSEGSSASNVRRIEAVTGPEAIGLLRGHDAILRESADLLKTRPDDVPARIAALKDQTSKAKPGSGGADVDVDAIAGQAEEISGVPVVAVVIDSADGKALPDIADRVRGKIGDGVVVLGGAAEGKAALLVSVAKPLTERRLSAGDIVKQAAPVMGGGGGGRPTMAQAGGKEPAKLGDAVQAAKAAVAEILAGSAASDG